MRKGEEKKQEIMRVAERLFCRNGFRETGVQEILDALKISKGAFYHYFESKDAVLELICAEHAGAAAALARRLLEEREEPLDRLNAVLYAFTPLRSEEASFLAMLLPQMFTKEGRTVALAWQDALTDAFLPIMNEELQRAEKAGLVCLPTWEGAADLLLTLCNRCSMRVMEMLLTAAAKRQLPETADLLDPLKAYRAMVERLLDAPFGSIVIIRLDQWYQTADAVSRAMLTASV